MPTVLPSLLSLCLEPVLLAVLQSLPSWFSGRVQVVVLAETADVESQLHPGIRRVGHAALLGTDYVTDYGTDFGTADCSTDYGTDYFIDTSGNSVVV